MSVKYEFIPGYNQTYRVGNDGSVWSCKTTRNKTSIWKRKKICIATRSGNVPIYCYVSLSHKSKVDVKVVSILVLELFVGGRPDGMECRHLNGNPLDNRLENLAWGTHKENCADRKRHGTEVIGEKNGMSRLTESKVRAMRLLRKQGYPICKIAELFQLSNSTTTCALNGNSWSHLPGAIKTPGGRGGKGVAKTKTHREKISKTLRRS